jgi:YlmC/YmxH family sporulation protein
MNKLSFRDLQQKDVINLCTGTHIGCVCELELDKNTGQICSLIVSRGYSICGFSKDRPIALPWCKIECIGDDAILIKVNQNELDRLSVSRKKLL